MRSTCRSYKRLTAAQVARAVAARVPGKFADGDGLHLVVAKSGSASWVYRYMISGRSHEMGLGPVRDIGLARARELAYDARQLKREGTDPVAARRSKRQGVVIAKAKSMTFEACARAYIIAKQAGWRSPQHKAQWVTSLETYVYPIIGKLPVESIDTHLVMQVLQPIWNDKPETASRVRGRIEMVLDWAAVSEYRSGENPARWRGHLQHKLTKRGDLKQVEHHPALPCREIAGFMSDLRALDDEDARALALAILCASRSKEVLEAPWEEFEQEDGVWAIPKERMKNKKEHRVPLAAAAQAIIAKQKAIRTNEFVFAGRVRGHAGKDWLSRVLKRLGRGGTTVHGFRSTFSDWCAECTNFPSEVREMALAHTVGNAVENAYRRGDMFAKRRALAEAWAAYCDGGAEVIDLAEVRSV